MSFPTDSIATKSRSPGPSWVDRVHESIRRAEGGKSRVERSLMAIEGCTSPRIRHLLNNLCEGADVHYLEVGSWHGATITAASCVNPGRFTAIDNFSWRPAAREFRENQRRAAPWCRFSFFERDCWDVRAEEIPPDVNVFFYDGDHSFEAQRRAFEHFLPAFADEFVAIVDDWNWSEAKEGTGAAIAELGLGVVREWVLPARYNGDLENWWNGLYIGVLRKGHPSAPGPTP